MSHILVDYFTIGGYGMMLLYPFSTDYFLGEFPVFFLGIQHKHGSLAGIFSMKNLFSVTLEFLFFVPFLIVIEKKHNNAKKKGTHLNHDQI